MHFKAKINVLGSDHEPNHVSMKIIFGIMAFFATLIFESYSANLISILLVNKVNHPFTSYYSLYYETDYKVAYIGGTNIDELFQVNNNLHIQSTKKYLSYFTT